MRTTVEPAAADADVDRGAFGLQVLLAKRRWKQRSLGGHGLREKQSAEGAGQKPQHDSALPVGKRFRDQRGGPSGNDSMAQAPDAE
jgi:hypothetical protein